MNYRKVLCSLIMLLISVLLYSQKEVKRDYKIIIGMETDLPSWHQSDFIKLVANPFNFDSQNYPEEPAKVLTQRLLNGYVRWEIVPKKNNEIYYVTNILLANGKRQRVPFIVEPGDSINICRMENEMTFSGRGAVKFKVGKLLELMEDSLEKTEEYKNLSEPSDRTPSSSLNDYLAWNKFLNNKNKLILSLLNGYKINLSKRAYETIKGNLLQEVEKVRMHKYHTIRRSKLIGPVNEFGLSNEDVGRIYDSTMNTPVSKWLRFERPYMFDVDYAWDMLNDDSYREKNKFFRTSDTDKLFTDNDPANKYISIYNMAKKKHVGIVRENLLAFTFKSSYGVLSDVGFTPKIEALLADYYSLPGFPEFKRSVRDYEVEQRSKWNRSYSQDFSLIDINGNSFSNEKLKGKVVVIDFWFTGCIGCLQMSPALKAVENYFANDTNIVFLGISIDKNKELWSRSLVQKKFTTGTGIQLYTGGFGKEHDVIKKFFIQSYPTLEIINPDGLFVKFDKRSIDPRIDSGLAMITLLNKVIASGMDGPYVYYGNIDGSAKACYISNGQIYKSTHPLRKDIILNVVTDMNTKFSVSLIPSLSIESSEFMKPEKLFVLSDIEGNFDVLRRLLQNNGVIDNNYNWIFGSGHLVFNGDMFDRGEQVTECLWLIYSLEEKAKKSGGYVHFILGNHEIMNIQGIDAYTKPKYKNNARLMNKTMRELYNKDSELGKWLRTKNIVEKVGDLLFVHGGISRSINQQTMDIKEINDLARSSFDKMDYNYTNANIIMNTSTSPFWYRTYYDDKRDMPNIIDSTINKFKVSRIITGHTIVADTVSVHYNGHVINVDTKHSEGKSEALLIEGEMYYRVDIRGRRILLDLSNKEFTSSY